MSTPTRLSNGISTNDAQMLFGNYPLPAPFTTSGASTTGVAQYANDFVSSVAEYTVSGSSSTFALTAGNGGLALLTPGGTTTATAAYKTASNVAFVAGNQLWFNARFKASAVSGTKSFYVGLRAGSSANDGIWFAKAVNLGFYYNGTDLLVFADEVMVARVSAPTIGSSATTLTNANLGPVMQITPTATDTLTVDYIAASVEVTR
jgi:hypothetical protein